MYFPRSSVNILEASKGELVYEISRKPYIGMYIETDEGEFYAGTDYVNLGPRLVKPQGRDPKFGFRRHVLKYHLLKPNSKQKLAKHESIIPSKTRPTEKDYEKGFMFRYYVQRVNDKKQIFEISQKTYDEFEQKYDNFLYQKGSLVWTLEGNVRKSNKLALEKLAKGYPYIERLFLILNEFESSRTSKGLFTDGGELYYENGREYIGPYHIHPDKGPMVGAEHVQQQHDTLVWAKNLQSPKELKGMKDVNYEKFLKEKRRKQIKRLKKGTQAPQPIATALGTSPTVSTPPTSTPPATSGGGGGGY